MISLKVLSLFPPFSALFHKFSVRMPLGLLRSSITTTALISFLSMTFEASVTLSLV